ncbi:hypothetical protein [Streptomyces sp. SudanB182_2057]|uniref:hypothetical protein n=1 Tax=Streptomyces sp. SudanB182_2057 TaxID=3035281 RepID=UPI003F571AA8
MTAPVVIRTLYFRQRVDRYGSSGPAALMDTGAAFAVLGPVMLTQVDDGPGFLVADSLLLFAGLTPLP